MSRSLIVLLTSFCMLGSLVHAYNITSAGIIGSGCPTDTAQVKISNDYKGVSLTFDKFVAGTGTPFTASEGRRNCQLTLSVGLDDDEQISFDEFAFNTVYGANANVRLTLNTYYYFQGSIENCAASKILTGPIFAPSFVATNEFATPIWSQCGGNIVLSFSTDVRAQRLAEDAEWGLWAILNSHGPNFVSRKCEVAEE